MGNAHNSGLEENFCVEITKEDMMMLRIELTTDDPSRALRQLNLQAYHMPYYVEQARNSAGQVWKSYHDLVGEIDSSIPATQMWRPSSPDADAEEGESWHPKHFPLAYGTCMNYAMKLGLPSKPYLKSVMPNLSPFLPDPTPRLCLEVSMEEMMSIRRALVEPEPAKMMRDLRLHADSMPYVVEAGDGYNSYHDLCGEIDPSKPANAGWEPAPWLPGPPWDPQFCAIPYGSLVAYAAKLDLPSLGWFKRVFPASLFLTDRRAMQLVALERQQAAQKARALEDRNRARKQAEQAERDQAAAMLRRQERFQEDAQQRRLGLQQQTQQQQRQQRRTGSPSSAASRLARVREQRALDEQRESQQDAERRRWQLEQQRLEAAEAADIDAARRAASSAVAAAPKVSPRTALRARGHVSSHQTAAAAAPQQRYVRRRDPSGAPALPSAGGGGGGGAVGPRPLPRAARAAARATPGSSSAAPSAPAPGSATATSHDQHMAALAARREDRARRRQQQQQPANGPPMLLE